MAELYALTAQTAEGLKQLLAAAPNDASRPPGPESAGHQENVVEIISLLSSSPVRHWRANLIRKAGLSEEWPKGSLEVVVASLHRTSTSELEIGKEYRATRWGVAPNGAPLYWVDFARETFTITLPNSWSVQTSNGLCTLVVATTRTIRFQGYGLTVSES